MGGQGSVWAAFLAMCFIVVGLAGGFALYGAPVPLARALSREAVLDRVLVASQAPDRAGQLAALRPALGPSADAVLDGPPEAIIERVVRERSAIQAEAEQEAAAVAARIRLTLAVVTVMAAAFGIGVLGLARRST